MFTGIVQDIGTILKIEGRDYDILTKLSEIKTGDSISVDGVCLTITNVVSSLQKSTLHNFVTAPHKNMLDTKKSVRFTVHVSKETFDTTTFKFLKSGSKVNLEPSLSVNDKISGHLLTGHVDTITYITDIRKAQESFIYRFKIPPEYKKYIVKKGSIGIDGISLTIADVSIYDFSVVIIPYTYEHTTLKYKRRNDKVNVEFDILSKYVYSIIKDIVQK